MIPRHRFARGIARELGRQLGDAFSWRVANAGEAYVGEVVLLVPGPGFKVPAEEQWPYKVVARSGWSYDGCVPMIALTLCDLDSVAPGSEDAGLAGVTRLLDRDYPVVVVRGLQS